MNAGGASPTSSWLLYGAYGFTGHLIARVAVARGHRPTLAGRDRARTRRLAEKLDLPYVSFGLEDPGQVRRAILGHGAVLHAAGPFSRSYRPMVEACLDQGVHYLDITGEIDVLEAVHGLDRRAREAGVVLLPGVGFDVVPTDCAAALAAARIEAPSSLDLAFVATGRPSSGTLRGMVEALGRAGAVRRGGRIVDVPQGSVHRTVSFSDRLRPCMAIPWGDVSTAWYSTGVPDIRVFTPVGRSQEWGLRVARVAGRYGFVRRLLDRALHRLGGGPAAAELEGGMTRVRAEARNEAGQESVEELTTPNGYTFTADAAVAAVSALLAPGGPAPGSGALTPSLAFGRDWVYGLEGVTRVVSTPVGAP